jgi:hypothetical protein
MFQLTTLRQLDISIVHLHNKIVCDSSYANNKYKEEFEDSNQNPYIEVEQTTQWAKQKGQKDKQRSTKHTHKTKDRVKRTTLKTEGELLLLQAFLLLEQLQITKRFRHMHHMEKANMQYQRIYSCDCNIAMFMNLDRQDFWNIYPKNVDESYWLTSDSMRSVQIQDILYNDTPYNDITCVL